MYSNLMPHSDAQFWIAELMYSGPLSHRITWGLPRHEMICLSSRITRSEGNEKSTSTPMASGLKSSITLNNRNVLPSSSWSCMKSIDHTWLMPFGTVRINTILQSINPVHLSNEIYHFKQIVFFNETQFVLQAQYFSGELYLQL